MAAFIPVLGASAEAADLPQWDLTKMEGLDASRWGPPTVDGKEACRVVKAGRTGVWEVPVWWGDSSRR